MYSEVEEISIRVQHMLWSQMICVQTWSQNTYMSFLFSSICYEDLMSLIQEAESAAAEPQVGGTSALSASIAEANSQPC